MVFCAAVIYSGGFQGAGPDGTARASSNRSSHDRRVNSQRVKYKINSK